MISACPCNSNKSFSDCCESYLNATQQPKTPEAFMRSRYTAYTLARIDYIQKTMCDKAAENFDPMAALAWAKRVTWLGLNVLNTVSDKDKGHVTFFARFSDDDKEQFIYEKSFFERRNDLWLYVDGALLEPKRNDPCPCASGKKSKKCCFEA